MKFESKYGLNEVCIVENKRQERSKDMMAKIISVYFSADGEVSYVARLDNGIMQHFMECELEGDPDYNEESEE